VLVGVGMAVVVVVVTCRTSTAGLNSSVVGFISVSRFVSPQEMVPIVFWPNFALYE
jgi:hypothetical protein